MAIRLSFSASLMLAALAWTAVPTGGATAADECLARPKGVAPAGKHWYYRTNREVKRRCWFLADAGEIKVAARRPKQPAAIAAIKPDQDIGKSADARAELVDAALAEQPATPIEMPRSEAAQIEAEGDSASPRDGVVASRWPTVAEALAADRTISINYLRLEAPAPVQGETVATSVNPARASSIPFAAAIFLVVVAGAIFMAFASRRRGTRDDLAVRAA